MKKILVTGKTGAVASAFQDYLTVNFPSTYHIDKISVKNNDYTNIEFSDYDAIFHCAGIVDINKYSHEDFEEINITLTKKLFKKAIDSNMKEFVFLSSMAVFGSYGSDCYKGGIIDERTEPKGLTVYGRSKLDAEKCILQMDRKNTRLSIVRAPSIIGRGTENYLLNYYKFFKTPLLPLMFEECKRSIIYIDCLSELVRLLIENNSDGIFHPQSIPLFSTSDFFKEIKEINHKKTILFKVPGWLQIHTKIFDRLYGNISYTEELSKIFDYKYNILDTKTAIKLTLSNNTFIL